jgi:hypothetical protein
MGWKGGEGKPKKAGLAQGKLSESRALSCIPGLVQLKLLSNALQNSKCPVSSEKAMLKECADHGTRVCSLELLYMGFVIYPRKAVEA